MKQVFFLVVLIVLAAVFVLTAQQPQTSDVTNTQPIYRVNAKYVQGIGPGYWPTAGAGLTLNLTAGTVWCTGTVRTYAGGTLTMTNSTTNYVYLDAASNCAPAVSTSVFASTNVPIAVVVAAGGAITTITDDRGALASFSGGSLGSVTSVTIAGMANQITVTGTCTITTTGTCTLSMPAGIILGTDNSVAGTVQLANNAANAHTIWGSAATTSNTILGFAMAPTTGHVVTCTVSGTTCTLTDGGAPAAGSVTSVTIAGTANQINTSGTCTITSTGTCTLSLAPELLATGTSVSLSTPSQIYVCTGTCTVTPPVPAAGYEFCVLNDDNVATVITLAALGSSARYENTARTAYGTAGTGTLVSGGAVKDMVCIVGRDATHYLTTNSNGTWTAN